MPGSSANVAGRSRSCGLPLSPVWRVSPDWRTLEPMHGERAGFREAGYWLAEHAQSADFIDDPYSWASYYAGRSFVNPPPYQPGTGHCVYVVIEWSSNKHPDMMPVSNMDYVFSHGQLIQSWLVRRRKETAEIVLYKVAF